jgi:hypothetical protein
MTALQRLAGLLRRDRSARTRAEQDAPGDPATSRSRPTGGNTVAPGQDRHSTTGATESGEYVGRAGGDEAGDTGRTGGEARSGHEPGAGDGAARPRDE